MFFGKRFHGHTKGDLSGLDILVLSIIRNKEGISGYEIGHLISGQFMGMWKASPGTIYPLLSRLAEKGYLIIREITDNNRQKKLYTVTDAGKEKLKNVLDNTLETSVRTLFDYVTALIDGRPQMKVKMNDCFCDWPSHKEQRREQRRGKVDVDDYSNININRIEQHLTRLRKNKQYFEGKVNKINEQITYHESLLQELKKKQKENEVIIETYSNEADFDN